MAWEKRGNKKYYYRKERVNGRVRSTYIGANHFARLAEQVDRFVSKKRRLTQILSKTNRDQLLREEQEADKILEELHIFTNAMIVINGYHWHKGELRRKRKCL